MQHTPNSKRGFTLLELMVSATIGLVVVGAAVSLFTQALKATWITSQKSELQQDFRSSSNLLQRDISMAGSGALGQQGISTSAIGLPVSAIRPVYPCSAITCNFVNGAPVAYPTSAGVPYLYSIIPGPNLGITVNAASGPTDVITIVSADPSLALNCYTSAIDNTGTIVTFTPPPAGPLPATCVLPTGILVPQSLIDPVVGLQPGDMVLFGTNAVGVVSNATAGAGGAFVVTFALGDPGHINQPSAATGSLSQFVAAGGPPSTPIAVSAVRLLAITYYLDISPSDGVTPRLMRLQNGKTAAPVAENVVFLKFSYDVYNNGTVNANQSTLPAGTSPNMITKVNIAHMTIRSQLPGTTGYQGLDLQTSIAARNLTSQQEYPIQGSSY